MTDTVPAAGHIPVTESWRRQARASLMRVVLADGDDKRAIDAAQRLDTEGLAIPVLLGDPAAFRSPAVQAEAEASPCNERIDLGDPLHVAALMVAAGEADACVGGATRPTADVVRAARYCIGPAPGVETISSCFLLVLPDGTPITFGDCAVVPEPDAGQLASMPCRARPRTNRSSARGPGWPCCRTPPGAARRAPGGAGPFCHRDRAAPGAVAGHRRRAAVRRGLGSRGGPVEGPGLGGRGLGQCVRLPGSGFGQHCLQDHRTAGGCPSVRAVAAGHRTRHARPVAGLRYRRHRHCGRHRGLPGRSRDVSQV